MASDPNQAPRKPRKRKLTKPTDTELAAKFRDRANRALDYLDDEALASARPHQLALVAGITLDKARLLEGLPTQIIETAEQRMRLADLVPRLIAEAQRRGISIDLEQGTGYRDITPDATETGKGNGAAVDPSANGVSMPNSGARHGLRSNG